MDDSAKTRPLERRAPRPVAIRVDVVRGPDARRIPPFEGGRVVVGRGANADLRLTDPTVSLFHAELTADERGVVIVDLGSLNGVRCGDVAIERAIAVRETLVVLGDTTLEVSPGSPAEQAPEAAPSLPGFVGDSLPMREALTMLERLARTELSVLIGGPTGSGKELAARALHALSQRTGGPFVVLDCGALPASLAASTLFGHERGAFTGASTRRPGIFEVAHGGTVFLDEVGELPLELQPMLLRVLEQRELVPLGSAASRRIDVRVVSATWRDLRKLVNGGSFREDLYYRLAQAVVRMPALEERREDIPVLVESFLQRLPSELRPARGIMPDALALLVADHYAGNVRELHSTVARIALLARGTMITAADVAFDRMLGPARDQSRVANASIDALQPYKDAKRTIVDEFERGYLSSLLERAEGNLSRAATAAGLQRHNLRDLLKKHGLHRGKS